MIPLLVDNWPDFGLFRVVRPHKMSISLQPSSGVTVASSVIVFQNCIGLVQFLTYCDTPKSTAIEQNQSLASIIEKVHYFDLIIEQIVVISCIILLICL